MAADSTRAISAKRAGSDAASPAALPIAPPAAPPAAPPLNEAEEELLRRAPVGLATLALDGTVLAHNSMVAEWLGMPAAEAPRSLLGANALDWLSPASRELCETSAVHEVRATGRLRELVVEVRDYAGESYVIILNADLHVGADGEERLHVALIDATERGRFEQELVAAQRSADEANARLVAMQEQLRHQALHDSLTELPNRVLLEEQLTRMLAAAARSFEPCAVLFLDLDGFKAINDEHGHQEGDAVLRTIGLRLRDTSRAGEIVGRVGGDEFVFAVGPIDSAGLTELGDRVLRQVSLPLSGASAGTPLSTSIGAAVWQPETGEPTPRAGELIAAADRAMYEAKRAGKGRMVQRTWHAEPGVDHGGGQGRKSSGS